MFCIGTQDTGQRENGKKMEKSLNEGQALKSFFKPQSSLCIVRKQEYGMTVRHKTIRPGKENVNQVDPPDTWRKQFWSNETNKRLQR